MGTWKECTISDLGEVVSGATPSTKKSENYENGNISWITPKDLSNFNGRYIFHGERNITEIGLNSCSAKLLPKNTILFSSRAPIGYVAIAGNNVCTNQGFKSVIPNKETDYLFLYYLLKYNKEAIESMGNGTTFKEVSGNVMKNIKVYVPVSKYEQKQIASILSSYDNLIENNQKQIRLLEEIAQRFYKEWFVDFHFPDYENIPVMDGVPEGWRIGRLDEIGEFKRGKTITKGSVIVGNVPVVASGIEPAYYHNIANTTAPVITISSSGANAGFTRMYHVDIWASDCSFVDINSTNYLYQIYCYLKASKNDLNRLQKGSAQPHVYAKDINAMKCLIPDEKTAVCFNTFVYPIFSKIGNLYEQIKNLKESRDLLLPKLMKGEIDVSKVRI